MVHILVSAKVVRVYKRKLNLIYDHVKHSRSDGVRYYEVAEKRLPAYTHGKQAMICG